MPNSPFDPFLIKILTQTDIYSNPNVTKASAYYNIRWQELPNIFDTQDRNAHSRKRKIVGQAVSDRTLRNFDPVMVSQIDVFIQQLSEASEKGMTVDITVLVKRLAIDIIGHLAFGYSLNTLTETPYRFLPDALGGSIFVANMFYTWSKLSYANSQDPFAQQSSAIYNCFTEAHDHTHGYAYRLKGRLLFSCRGTSQPGRG